MSAAMEACASVDADVRRDLEALYDEEYLAVVR